MSNAIDSFGLYSFQLLNAPIGPQQFTISFGDTVSDGVPTAGAGNLEVPGAVDIYIFDALAEVAAEIATNQTLLLDIREVGELLQPGVIPGAVACWH